MLLDTNVVSNFLKPSAAEQFPAVDKFVREVLEESNLAISCITQFELRRGVEALALKGQGKTRRVKLLKFLDRCDVLGLDVAGGAGWNYAAALWAKLKNKKPSITLADADLLIAATAGFHRRTLVTAEKKLVENLRAVGFDDVRLLTEA
jgi:predicted nucleic acid-binding protein